MTDQDGEKPQRSFVPSASRVGIAAVLSRGSIVVTGILIATLMPLTLPPTEVARFFLAQILIAAFSVFSQFGLIYTAPAVITAAYVRGDHGRARQALLQILGIPAATGTVVAIALWALVEAFSPSFPELAQWRPVLPIVVLSIPFAALGAVIIECVRALHIVRLSMVMMMTTGWVTSTSLLVALVAHWHLQLGDVLIITITGPVVILLTGLAGLWWKTRTWRGAPLEPIALFSLWRDSLPNWGTNLVLFVLGQSDMVLLAWFATLEDVAWYGIAIRVGTVLITPLSIANTGIAPVAVHLWTEGRKQELQALVRRLVIGVSAATSALYLGFALLGMPLINIWNPHYAYSYWLALVLGLGQIVHALGGSSGTLVLVMGDQRMAFRYTLVNSVMTIILCYAGLRLAGPIGLAGGAAIGMAVQTIMFAVRMKRRFGVDASILSVATRSHAT